MDPGRDKVRGLDMVQAPWAARMVVMASAALLLAYTVLRAIHVSFTWDETWSYIHYVVPREYFQTAFDAMGANHHLLNVWGMIAADSLFGNSELALRLPALLAHAVYLYATARIALQARSSVVAIMGFIVLNAHTYLLDFFALARGYGLAIGFMMLSLWWATRYLNGGRRLKWLVLAMLAAIFSALANLTMVNYLLALAAGFTLFIVVPFLRGNDRPVLRQLWAVAQAVCVGLAATLPIAIPLAKGDSLYFGCDSFWGCTLVTFSDRLLYFQHYGVATAPHVAFAVVLLLPLVCVGLALLAAFRSGWWRNLRPMLFGAVVLITCVGASFMQDLLLGTPFPQHRTALFLLPLFLFTPVSGLVAWSGHGRAPRAWATLLALPLLIHFARSANLTYAAEWRPEGELSNMLAMVRADHPPLGEDRPVITLASSFVNWGCIPYYQVRDGTPWLLLNLRNATEPFMPSDYYIMEEDARDRIDSLHWQLMYHSGPTGTSLYRDQRLRAMHRKAERHLLDMETPGIHGRSDEQRASGRYAVRFDAAVRSTTPINWLVPDTLEAGMVQLYGTALTLQPRANNWVALVLRVARGNETLAMNNVSPTVGPRHADQWGRLAVAMVPMQTLLPGDTVQLSAWPMFDDNVMYLDDMELWVVRE